LGGTFGPKEEKGRGGGEMEKIPNLFSAPNIRITQQSVTSGEEKERGR